MTLSDISKPIKDNLYEFNTFFNKQLETKVSLLNLIIKYITSKKGKQIRPLMVLLSAEVCGGISQRSYVAATLVELLHTATLVHDDVVDEASERRGIASINAKWNNKIAVLIGDFLLSRGLLTAIENKEFGFLEVTTKAVKRMSEGELMSIERTKSDDINEDSYFRIIGDKTASLISTCCEIGALSSTDDPLKHEALRNFGETIGIAFQIRDDIFDYISRSSIIGKPVGNDLKEKKVTLPLIYAVNNNKSDLGKKYIKLVKKGKLTKKDISDIITFVVDNGGIEYAENKATELCNKAKNYLSIFPDSIHKDSLISFADFVVQRKS